MSSYIVDFCLQERIALYSICVIFFFFFKQKTAYEMRISDWSSDVCSSDLIDVHNQPDGGAKGALARTLLCRSSPSPRSAANSLISSIAGSSLGSCATDRKSVV